MKSSSFGIKATLLTTMILSGQVMAQNLPDEINHPHYLRIYQNLDQVLSQKIADYNKLNDQKIEIQKTIDTMEKDRIELPQRNAELKRIIESRRAEIGRLDSEIQGLESVLGKIIEDLRRMDNTIAQLQRDIGQEGQRAQSIEFRRNQVAQDVARLNANLQRELQEENQSVLVLNRLTGEMNASLERRHDVQRDRGQLIRDAERFRTEIPQAKAALNQSTSAFGAKKSQLSEAEAKLPGIKTELGAEEAKLSQIDQVLTPKRSQLISLKGELARLSPDIARLQNENRSLEQKISANKTKISSLNVEALIARRDALDSQISGVKNQIKNNSQTIETIQAKIRPVEAQINDITQKMREAMRRRDMQEVARLKAEFDVLNKSLEADQNEIRRLQNDSEKLSMSIAARQAEINSLSSQITNAENRISSLKTEINSANDKIAENERKITELSSANSELSQKIAVLEAEIKSLESQREPLGRKVAALKQQEAQTLQQISLLKGEAQRLEAEIQKLNQRIAEMEKTISEFPQLIRKLDAHLRLLDEKVSEHRREIDREQRLLARIRQDRIVVQQQRDVAQKVLDEINEDLSNSDRLIVALRNELNEESRNRDALIRYNQDSVRKLDGLKSAKASAEKAIADNSREIQLNDQDLATIAEDLPAFMNDLKVITPKVVAAEAAKGAAETNVANANSQYQSRLSLYQKYLTDAQNLGVEKAQVGAADGLRAGSVDAKTKALRLGSESASSEAKWEAIRRAYVRGEIAGFKNGFEIGMSSASDAQRGEEEGRLAGTQRAKDHANMVIKPEKYLEEFQRRLKDDETSANSLKHAKLTSKDITNLKAMSLELKEIIPDLTGGELDEASRIISSLDALITQSDFEIKDIIELRKNLKDPRKVYSSPGPGENVNTVNCSAVYKGVKDFIEACKGSYVLRYQGLYNTAHEETFYREYTPVFNAQIEKVFETELNRLYPGFFKEASNVGKEAGIALGKKEIFQENFNRSENIAYAGKLPFEISRVENEAVNLVQEHLNQNAALTIRGNAKLSSRSIFGIAPGVDTELKMLIKNIGAEASQGNSFVRINEVSENLSFERKEAPLGAVAARSHADLSVMKVRVNDTALPGTKAIIAGEIVHPGNHYRSSRIETFRLEALLAVNPSIDAKVELDLTPKVSGFLGIKKHEVNIVIKPKFSGVEKGYETTIEEVGSEFMNIVTRPSITEVLDRNTEKKVTFIYKLSKASRGKAVTMRVTVKNEGRIVYENMIQVKPE
jgi:predicted  nucleic acid-binding Zn-ribbon protein